MADQNVNINIQEFDRDGTPPGTSIPPGSAPQPGGTTPPPGYDPHEEDRRQDRESRTPRGSSQEVEDTPFQIILDSLTTAVRPFADQYLGRPITSAIGSAINAGRSIYNATKLQGQAPSASPVPADTPVPTPAATTPGSTVPPPTPPPTGPGLGYPAGAGAAGVGAATAGGSGAGGAGVGAATGAAAGGGGAGVGTGAATAAGAGGAAGGGAAAIAGLAGPIGLAIIAVGAMTAAFLYAKERMLEAANDGAMFAPQSARAKVNQDVTTLMNRINRAQEMDDQFSELINLQTEANTTWNNLSNEIMKIIGPAIIEGMKILNLILETLNLLLFGVRKLMELNNLIFGEWGKLFSPLSQLAKIYDILKAFKDQEDQDKAEAIVKEMDAIINPMLEGAKLGQQPVNKGLGF
jgi:hypothetical protein